MTGSSTARVAAFLAAVCVIGAGGAPVSAENGRQTAPDDLRPAGAVAWRVSELLGKPVRNSEGVVLGEIEDLVVDQREEVVHAIVSVGGFLDIGDKLVAVPFSRLRVDSTGTILLDTTEAQLAERPHFRFPDSPLTGPVRPGEEMPQKAVGKGDPDQPMESVPGVLD